MSSIMREDWLECTLDEVCEVLDNLRKPINSNERNERIKGKDISELYPYYGATGQVGYIDDYLTDGEYILLGEDAAPFLDSTKDVAYKIIGKTWVNNHAHILKSHFNDDFLLHFLNQFQYRDYVTGTTRLKLTQGALKRMPAKLAPLPIQRAIVSKIEALFSDLDNGIANFKKAQEQLKIYRQAVLKKAFEGKLSELGKVGLKDDRIIDVEKDEKTEILKSNNPKNPNSDNEEDNLPKEWKWVKSGELFSFVTSGSRGWAKYYSESGSIFIRITNLNFDTLNLDLREEKIQYVNPPQNSEGLRTRVQEGDFLFSITGYLGMFAIAPKLENAFVNQHVSLCRPKDFFDKKYLAYWIISKSGGHYYLNKNQKGAVKAGLNLDDLKNFPVPLPSTFAEQTQIVQEIERRLSVCDKMEQSINESLEKAEALRQSILKKAFDGKLLSQAEIEQCKRAADYEPASELLKKIKAEKLAKEQEKKKPIVKKKGKK